MKECREFLVFGRVQGVGFRAFIKAKVDSINAQESLISGYICNLNDGSVRVIAQGESEILDTLAKILKVGTIHSVVKQVQTKKLDIDESICGFEILRLG